MLDQNTFMETVHAVSEIIRTSQEPLTKEEILSYFKDMELNENQQNMVLEFLLTPHEETGNDEADEQEAEKTSSAYDTEVSGNNGETEEPMEDEDASSDEKQKENSEEDILPHSAMFQMYLEELAGIPEYTKEEMSSMYGKLLSGDEGMIHKISNAWLKNVLNVAKKLAVSPDGFEDVVQEGNMGLFLCLSDLCGSKETVDVEKELLTAVEESMKACIRELTGEDEDENAVVGKVSLVNEAVNYLKKENGKEPSIRELSDYTHVSEDELSDLLELIRKAEEQKKKKER